MPLPRLLTEDILRTMRSFPAVGIVGPRQCGKSTLVRELLFEEATPVRYLDLERPSDRAKLERPEDYLATLRDYTVVLDEVQVMPELFTVLRPLIDEDRRPGRFILLGSASPELVRGASESLAGRIAYRELTPLLLSEVDETTTVREHWTRGGYPDALLAPDAQTSADWRASYLESYVTRDLPAVYPLEQPAVVRRLLAMLAGQQGDLLNYNSLSRALGVTQPTVKRYVGLLEGSFLLRRLPPYHVNVRKRLVKSPKAYIRDSGLLHALAGLETYDDLLNATLIGGSWEGYVVEQVAAAVSRRAHLYFYRTHTGNEVDLVIIGKRGRMACVEIKVGSAPTLSKSFYSALEDLGPERTLIVAQVDEAYAKGPGIDVVPLEEALRILGGW